MCPSRMFQPDYTNCPNCGTVDHNDYDCPCGCHGDEAPSRARQARRVQKLPKLYELHFYGRKAGAIGIFYWVTTRITAGNEQVARLKLYDEYDHVQGLTVKEVQE